MLAKGLFSQKLIENKALYKRFLTDAQFHSEITYFVTALEICYLALKADEQKDADKIIETLVSGWFIGREE